MFFFFSLFTPNSSLVCPSTGLLNQAVVLRTDRKWICDCNLSLHPTLMALFPIEKPRADQIWVLRLKVLSQTAGSIWCLPGFTFPKSREWTGQGAQSSILPYLSWLFLWCTVRDLGKQDCFRHKPPSVMSPLTLCQFWPCCMVSTLDLFLFLAWLVLWHFGGWKQNEFVFTWWATLYWSGFIGRPTLRTYNQNKLFSIGYDQAKPLLFLLGFWPCHMCVTLPMSDSLKLVVFLSFTAETESFPESIPVNSVCFELMFDVSAAKFLCSIYSAPFCHGSVVLNVRNNRKRHDSVGGSPLTSKSANLRKREGRRQLGFIWMT